MARPVPTAKLSGYLGPAREESTRPGLPSPRDTHHSSPRHGSPAPIARPHPGQPLQEVQPPDHGPTPFAQQLAHALAHPTVPAPKAPPAQPRANPQRQRKGDTNEPARHLTHSLGTLQSDRGKTKKTLKELQQQEEQLATTLKTFKEEYQQRLTNPPTDQKEERNTQPSGNGFRTRHEPVGAQSGLRCTTVVGHGMFNGLILPICPARWTAEVGSNAKETAYSQPNVVRVMPDGSLVILYKLGPSTCENHDVDLFSPLQLPLRDSRGALVITPLDGLPLLAAACAEVARLQRLRVLEARIAAARASLALLREGIALLELQVQEYTDAIRLRLRIEAHHPPPLDLVQRQKAFFILHTFHPPRQAAAA